FVQVIYILRNDGYLKVLFRGGNGQVGGIRCDLLQLCSSRIVELQHLSRMAVPGFRCGDIFNPVSLPESAGVTKGTHAAFRTYPGTGQDDELRCRHLPGRSESRFVLARQMHPPETL